MNSEFFQAIKTVSYFIWEYTGHDNALTTWYCAEDIASYIEKSNIIGAGGISTFCHTSRNDAYYISFVRHIAFRIYIYTRCDDALRNWFIAERLIFNSEWNRAAEAAAGVLRGFCAEASAAPDIQSEMIRNYYRRF